MTRRHSFRPNRWGKRRAYHAKKQRYKARLRQLQEENGDDVSAYRLAKAKLQKLFGYAR